MGFACLLALELSEVTVEDDNQDSTRIFITLFIEHGINH